MKRFRFRLETLLRLRRLREDQARAELARAVGARSDTFALLQETDREDEDARAALRRAEGAGVVETADLAALARCRFALELRRRRLGDDLLQADRRVAERRQALAVATRERRALEALEERRRDEWRREAEREERKELDEIAVTAVHRRRAEQARGSVFADPPATEVTRG